MPFTASRRLVVAATLSVLGLFGVLKALAETQQGACIPQGFLVLDKKAHYPQRPYVAFPFCSKYQQCSCCNVSHSITIQRSLKDVQEDATFPRECVNALSDLACRVCDPEVGVGLKETVCSKTCDAWFSACQNQFFSYGQMSARLSPCQENGPLICTRLRDLADDGEEFCKFMGLKVSSSEAEDCWSGEPVPSADFCSQPAVQVATFWWFEHIQWVATLLALLLLFFLFPCR